MNRIRLLGKYLFNSEVAQKSRLAWVDYAKGIALILVAYRHVLYGFQRSGLQVHPYLMNANMIFYSFRMPLFFILSGIFITKSLVKRTAGGLMIKKAQDLLWPYLVWAVIQISMQILFSRYTNADRSTKSYEFILTQPDNLDQLWYLFALFNVSIVYIFLKVYAHLGPWVQLIIGLVFYYLSTIMNTGPQHDLLYYYFFFALGDLISAYMLNQKLYRYFSSSYTFIILLPLFIIANWYFLGHEQMQYTSIFLFALIALIGCAFMLNCCFLLQNWGKLNFLKIVGFHSLYIYVMHVMLVSFFRTFFVRVFGITSVSFLLPVDLFLGITLSIMIYNLAIRSGFWFLYSLDKERTRVPKMEFRTIWSKSGQVKPILPVS